MKDCVGFFGKLFGHQFEARGHLEKGQHDLKHAPSHWEVGDVVMIMEASKPSKFTYLFSECARCGIRIAEEGKDKDHAQ